MSAAIVFIAGSPSTTSRSSAVAQTIAAHATKAGFEERAFALRDFDPGDVLAGRKESPRLQELLAAVRGAAAIVLSSPVYKASYTGGLKALVDLIPPDDLVGKPALGIVTSRLADHGEEASGAYRALFRFFRAKPAATLVVLDEELRAGDPPTLSDGARERVDAAARALVAAAQHVARAGSPG